jgi:hypothetical protein
MLGTARRYKIGDILVSRPDKIQLPRGYFYWPIAIGPNGHSDMAKNQWPGSDNIKVLSGRMSERTVTYNRAGEILLWRNKDRFPLDRQFYNVICDKLGSALNELGQKMPPEMNLLVAEIPLTEINNDRHVHFIAFLWQQ